MRRLSQWASLYKHFRNTGLYPANTNPVDRGRISSEAVEQSAQLSRNRKGD